MATAADDFAGTGALSASWTVATGTASRVAGVLTGSVWPWLGYWNATTLSASQDVRVTLTGVPANAVSVVVRFTAGFNGYTLLANSGGNLVIQRSDAGVPTTLETVSGFTFIAGDIPGLRAIASALRAVYNGVVQGTGATDATYSAAANAGVSIAASGDTVDNWVATDIVHVRSAAGARQAVKRGAFF